MLTSLICIALARRCRQRHSFPFLFILCFLSQFFLPSSTPRRTACCRRSRTHFQIRNKVSSRPRVQALPKATETRHNRCAAADETSEKCRAGVRVWSRVYVRLCLPALKMASSCRASVRGGREKSNGNEAQEHPFCKYNYGHT